MDKPILMSSPMVRALLSGTKKQTRRVSGLDVLNADPGRYDYLGVASGPGAPHYAFHDRKTGAQTLVQCRSGQPGDLLWVREAWRTTSEMDKFSGSEIAKKCIEAGYVEPWAPLHYEADGVRRNWMHTGIPPHGESEPAAGRYRHARFMPRWASRITLEITEVRVELLNYITEADAWAEGCARGDPDDVGGFFPAEEQMRVGRRGWDSAIDWYADLWEAINGEGSWDANPWVWAISFKRLTP